MSMKPVKPQLPSSRPSSAQQARAKESLAKSDTKLLQTKIGQLKGMSVKERSKEIRNESSARLLQLRDTIKPGFLGRFGAMGKLKNAVEAELRERIVKTGVKLTDNQSKALKSGKAIPEGTELAKKLSDVEKAKAQEKATFLAKVGVKTPEGKDRWTFTLLNKYNKIDRSESGWGYKAQDTVDLLNAGLKKLGKSMDDLKRWNPDIHERIVNGKKLDTTQTVALQGWINGHEDNLIAQTDRIKQEMTAKVGKNVEDYTSRKEQTAKLRGRLEDLGLLNKKVGREKEGYFIETNIVGKNNKNIVQRLVAQEAIIMEDLLNNRVLTPQQITQADKMIHILEIMAPPVG